MPGELITADWQVEIRGLLLGPGTDYLVQGLPGIDNQKVKPADLDRLGDGSTLGVDRLASRTVVLTVTVVEDVPATLQDKLDAFLAAWTIGDDVELHWQLAGEHRYLVGRTRNVAVDARLRHAGRVEIDAEFIAGDPTVLTYGAS